MGEIENFNPFNLFLGNFKKQEFFFVDYLHKTYKPIETNQWHGVSNNLFQHSSWEKVEKGLDYLKNADYLCVENVFNIMEDKENFGEKIEEEASIYISPFYKDETVAL